jgi:hypothetical protein
MHYTKCILERCVSESSNGGSGEFRTEWIPTRYAVKGTRLRLEEGFPWFVAHVGATTTVISYVEKLGADVLECFKPKPWYEALTTRKNL